MNKLIKELAVQAGAYWNHGDFNMGCSVEFQEVDLEKFAELVVKEVFTKIEAERFEVYRPVKESVMNHFGIEE